MADWKKYCRNGECEIGRCEGLKKPACFGETAQTYTPNWETRKEVIVGLYIPDFCDQGYIRDRDERVLAKNEEEAKVIFRDLKYTWLCDNEIRFIKVWNSEADYKRDCGVNQRMPWCVKTKEEAREQKIRLKEMYKL